MLTFPTQTPSLRGAAALALALCAVGARASTADRVDAQLEQMRAHRYSAPAPVPAGGLTFGRDTATWTFESGSLRLQEPVGGVTTGLVFEGRGRF